MYIQWPKKLCERLHSAPSRYRVTPSLMGGLDFVREHLTPSGSWVESLPGANVHVPKELLEPIAKALLESHEWNARFAPELDATDGRIRDLFSTIESLRPEIVKRNAEIERLRVALRESVRVHDGTHSEDCNAFGSGCDDADLTDDDGADPACDCGATAKRDELRAVLGKPGSATAKLSEQERPEK